MKKKIFFLATHRLNSAPSQRFRFEQFLPYLNENGFEYTFSNLLTANDHAVFYAKGNYFKKMFLLLKMVGIRFKNVIKLNDYDIIFIQRESLIFGPALFEWIFYKSKSKVIYDFDDSIWMTNVSDANRYFGWLKFPQKISSIIKKADLVFAGNHYLADYALNFNTNVEIVPTTIDTDIYKPNQKEIAGKICIGWSGSETTIQHMRILEPVFLRLKQKYGDLIYFKIIGSKNYVNEQLQIKSLPWNFATELEDLSEIDIGVMPLPDDEWARGKCGLKGLQYMALGIATIMSPVGVNKNIIQDGINGYLASGEDEWVSKISDLIENKETISLLGKNARQTVVDKYSTEANLKKYINAFNNITNRL